MAYAQSVVVFKAFLELSPLQKLQDVCRLPTGNGGTGNGSDAQSKAVTYSHTVFEMYYLTFKCESNENVVVPTAVHPKMS